MQRAQLLCTLAAAIAHTSRPHPLRVAIDGVDASGKTCLAEELAQALRELGCPIIRASIDGFHQPRAVRYQRGPDSPAGYFLDSYDLPALIEQLLQPLGPGGSRLYRTAIFDYRLDAPLPSEALLAPQDAILLLDGIFLLRAELLPYWDLRIFVAAQFDQTLRRALRRDASLFGSEEEVVRRYQARYIPAQRLYLSQYCPTKQADWLVDNNDFDAPDLRPGGRAALS
jgi:uridine kinase